MHREDRGCPLGDCCLDLGGIDIQGGVLNVNHNRIATLPDYARCCRHIAEGCGYHLLPDIQCAQCELQRNGTIGDVEKMLQTQLLFESKLKLIDQRSMICQPATIPD